MAIYIRWILTHYYIPSFISEKKEIFLSFQTHSKDPSEINSLIRNREKENDQWKITAIPGRLPTRLKVDQNIYLRISVSSSLDFDQIL